jgi:putative endonuclease
MAKTAKRQTGDLGEGVACKYLENKGFRILDRNYLRPWGEIDIVAEDGAGIRFVEVKTVTRATGFRPEENVHPAKLKRLHRAIQTYLLDHKVPEAKAWQVDVACVYLDFSTRRAKVELLENVIL